MRVFIFLFIPYIVSSQVVDLTGPLRILALGDSYTIGESVGAAQRWPGQLKDSLAARGINTQSLTYIATTGWRTDNLLNAIKGQGLDKKQYNLVTLLIGVNNQYQGKPFSQYISEFPALLDSAIRFAGGAKNHVMVVSIPDYAYTPFGQQSGNASLISQQINQYNAYSKQMADSLHIKYIDITPISRQGVSKPTLVAGDGLHPSAEQYTEWVKLMLSSLTLNPVGLPLKKKQEAIIKVGPSPFKDNLQFDVPALKESELTEVEIYNGIGTLVFRQEFRSGNFLVDLSEEPDGMYLVNVRNANMEFSRRLVKMR
jgi:lysophospholipase L1-like esterase